MSSRRALIALLFFPLLACAQQPPASLLPAPLPVKVEATPGFSLAIERAFAAHSLKGEAFASLTFSPDGKTLATAASDGSARLWTLSGELLRRVENGNMVFKVRFDQSGERFITAVYDGHARLWDRSGKLLHEYSGHRSAVTDALFIAGGNIATGSDDGSVIIFSADGKKLASVTQQGVARNQVVSPDGKVVACAFDSGEVRVVDDGGRLLHEFATAQGRINDIRFSPDGTQLLTSGFDGTARLWTITGKPLMNFAAGDGDWVYSAAFSRDGAVIGTVSGTGVVTVWTESGKQLAQYRSPNGRINSIAFSPTEDRFATIDHNGSLLLFTYHRD
jgi:centriolar protein POC1